MPTIRKILAATAVAGAATVSMLAGAAPASAAPATTDVGITGWGYYSGYGSGSTASFAIWSAENDADRWAQIDGFNPFVDCWTTWSTSTKYNDYYYTANVRITCYKP